MGQSRQQRQIWMGPSTGWQSRYTMARTVPLNFG